MPNLCSHARESYKFQFKVERDDKILQENEAVFLTNLSIGILGPHRDSDARPAKTAENDCETAAKTLEETQP